MIFPNDNLPRDAKPWARAITSEVSNLIDTTKSESINNAARDSEMNSALISVASALIDVQQATADVTAIVNNIYVDGTTTLDGSIMASGTLSASKITTGTLNASLVSVTNLNATNITTGTLNASTVSVTNLNASNITTGTLNASVVSVTNINASNITSGTITGRTLQTASSGQRVTVSGTSNSIFFYDVNGSQVGYMNGGGIGREGEFIITGPATNYNISFGGSNTLIQGGASTLELTNGIINVSGSFNSLDVSGGPSITAGSGYTASGVTQAIIGPSGGVYPTNGTQTGTANVIQDASSAILRRVSSARRYKLDIQDVDYGLKALNLRPRTWIDKTLYEENGNSADGLPRIPGFVAEEVNEAGLHELVKFNENGEVESLHYDRMLGAVIPVIKHQQLKIQELESRLSMLEGK